MALSSLSSLSDLGSLSSQPSTATDSSTAPASSSSGPSFLTGTIAQIAIILLGLLFIGAGLFSFDKTKELVVKAGKAAAIA